MRHTQLLAASAAMLALTAPAGAQARTNPAPRAEIAGPGGRTFVFESDDTPRAALGVNTSATGTRRDTLGLLITSIVRGGPAEKAGLEEGNRIAAINGVSLRANVADIDDYESAGTLSRRLVRELEKAKPGDEVDLRIYREGRTQNVRVRTVSSDSLFKRATTFRRVSRDEMDERPALGIGLGSSGSRRDTLGVLVMSVQDSSPAARAGLEEGNRIAEINGVNLRVAHEDAEDPSMGRTKAQRLMREVSQLKPGDNVTMRVYANGQYREVTMKVARAGDLPRSRGMTYFGGWDFPPMPTMPAMPAMPAMPRGAFRAMESFGPVRMEVGPEVSQSLQRVRARLDALRPRLERIRTEVPRVRVEFGGRGMEL
jgi:serine protease Do